MHKLLPASFSFSTFIWGDSKCETAVFVAHHKIMRVGTSTSCGFDVSVVVSVGVCVCDNYVPVFDSHLDLSKADGYCSRASEAFYYRERDEVQEEACRTAMNDLERSL